MRATHAKGFSLIELLVVIGVLALLLAILVPSLQKAREQARQAVCRSTLRGLAVANAVYAHESDGFSVHGQDMQWAWGNTGWNDTGFGRNFQGTYIFDDDWYDSRPGVEGRNLHGGGQNICGVGQLMWGLHVPEAFEAVACPQADWREGLRHGMSTKTYTKHWYWWDWGSSAKGCVESDWRQDAYNGNAGYSYVGTTYAVRGPLFRGSTVRIPWQGDFTMPASRLALFVDHERDGAAAVNAGVPVGVSPLPYWPRMHVPGFNVVYLDGHVGFFEDEQRVLTYQCASTRWYGNENAIMYGGYDAE